MHPWVVGSSSGAQGGQQWAEAETHEEAAEAQREPFASCFTALDNTLVLPQWPAVTAQGQSVVNVVSCTYIRAWTKGGTHTMRP